MTDEYDVVVVGSGGAPLTGAFLAQKAGPATVVVEKTALLGGTSAYSGGACWLPGSQVQQRAGIPTRPGRRATTSPRSWSRPNEVRIEAFLAHAPDLVAELEADDAIDFEWLPFPEYYDAPRPAPFGCPIQPTSVKRGDLPARVGELVRPPVERDRVGEGGHNTLSGGQALIARLLDGFLREGGTVRTDLPVTGYVLDGDRVAGVAAMTPEGPVEIRARRPACWWRPAASRQRGPARGARAR